MSDWLYTRPYSRDFTRYSPWKTPDCQRNRLPNDRYLSHPYPQAFYDMNCNNRKMVDIMCGTSCCSTMNCGSCNGQGPGQGSGPGWDTSNYCNPSFDSQKPGM